MIKEKIVSLVGIASVICGVAGCKENAEEKQFRQFVATHVVKIEPILKNLNLGDWNAAVSGRKEDYDKLAQLQLAYREVYSNKTEFEQLKAFRKSGKISDPLLARQLVLLYNLYQGNQIPPDLLEQIVKKESEVQNAFNVFRAKIKGREMTNNEILEVLKNETRSPRRQAAWEASKQIGRRVADDLIKLIQLRNQAAQGLGFENYYAMALAVNEQNEEELVRVFEELATLTDKPFRKLKTELDGALASLYRVHSDQIAPWHYHDPFFQEAPQVYHVDLDRYFSNRDVSKVAVKFYSSIGMPVDDILARSDLHEKPGKNQHAFCADIDRLGDVRVLANLRDNESEMETLLHELGHGVYDKYIDPRLPFLLRDAAHPLATEAIALLFGRLPMNPVWLQEMMGPSKNEVAQIADAAKKSLRAQRLIFARWCQVMFNFERALYKNPEQDLNSLWWVLVEKYQLVKRPAKRNEPDWASKPHFVIAPVYYHNYMLGDLMATQLQAYIVKNVLRSATPEASSSYVNRPEVGEYLKTHIFRYGASVFWNELLIHATGEPLTAKYFAAQYVK